MTAQAHEGRPTRGLLPARPAVAAGFVYQSFMWGSTYLFIKVLTRSWPPILAAGVRNSIALLVMLLIIWALRRPLPRTWRDLWPPLVFGIINGTSFALAFSAQPYIPSGQAAVLVATMPVFTLFIARWWLGESLAWHKALGVALGLAGVLLATTSREGVGFGGTDGQRLLGQLAMLAAACCYAISYAVGKKYFRFDSYGLTAGHLFSSSIYLLGLSLLFDGPGGPGMFEWPAIGALLYLAIPGSALAYACMFFLVQNLSATQAAYVSIINPVVAVILGALVLGETFTLPMAAGTALVLAGSWLIGRGRP